MPQIKLIHICDNQSDAPFIAEIRLHRGLNLEQTFAVVQRLTVFERITYLRKIGVLRVTIRGKSIIIFKEGRITINSVKDIKEAADFVQLMVKYLI